MRAAGKGEEEISRALVFLDALYAAALRGDDYATVERQLLNSRGDVVERCERAVDAVPCLRCRDDRWIVLDSETRLWLAAATRPLAWPPIQKNRNVRMRRLAPDISN